MSITQIIASDYPLPLMEMDNLYIGCRVFPHGKYGDGTDEADTYIEKNYKYSINLNPNETCVALFKKYLNENMKINSEVKIWGIWLGTGFKETFKYRPPLQNISKDVYNEVFEEMDYYIESQPAVIEKIQTSIQELTKEDILYFNNSKYICVSIRK